MAIREIEDDVPAAGLNTRDRQVAERLAFSADEKVANREQEALLRPGNLAQLDEAIRGAATPEIRRTLVEERARVAAGPGVMPPAPRPPIREIVDETGPAQLRLREQPAAGGEDLSSPEYLQKWNAAFRAFTATGPRLKPGQSVIEAFEEQSGMKRPVARRGESVAYGTSKLAAGIGGFMLAGPVGATFGEGAVRAASLLNDLWPRVQRGEVDVDEAAGEFVAELSKGMATDLAWNVAGPLLVKTIAVVPGMRRLAAAVAKRVQPLVQRAQTLAQKGLDRATAGIEGPVVPMAGVTGSRDEVIDLATAAERRDAARLTPQQAKMKSRAKLTEDPYRREAVGELEARMGKDRTITPGMVTDEPGFVETMARKGSPKRFDEAEREAQDAATRFLDEQRKNIGREAIGTELQGTADDVERAVKARLANSGIWERAKRIGAGSEADDMVKVIDDALLRHDRTPGGFLQPGEANKLRSIRADLIGAPVPASTGNIVDEGGKAMVQLPAQPAKPLKLDPDQILSFETARKTDMRNLEGVGVPSDDFQRVMGELVKKADEAYNKAAASAGKGALYDELKSARNQYREMIQTVYGDTFSKAAKRTPEDVARMLWGGGNVKEIKDAHKLIDMAVAENTKTAEQAAKFRGELARSFLDNQVVRLQDAAQWSEKLRNPLVRDSWRALTAGPGGAELDRTMKVVEQAAQVAQKKGVNEATGQVIPLPHAIGRGIAAVTGTNQPGFVAYAISISGLTRAAAAAYTYGEKGVLNAIAALVRAGQAGTPAAAAGTAKAAQIVNDFIKKHPELEEQQ